MFWKYNTNSSSQIEALLAKEDVTLQEVMDAEDIINDCRVQNKTLIDFLVKPEVMEELVTLTIKEPPIELEERIRFKYPNIACELLTCDVPSLNERLASDKVLLEKLYNFLETEPPLNPLLASYFSKIMGALIAKKTEQNWLSYQFTCLQVLDFLKAKDTFISLLLKHLGTSAIMDLMLKLMTQVGSTKMRRNILNWLDSQRIMQSLVSLFNPKIDRERHFNVAQLLCDFIRLDRDCQRNLTAWDEDPLLLNTLELPETVSLLLDNILEGEKSESAIVGGIQVLLALLGLDQSSIPKFGVQCINNPEVCEEPVEYEQKQKFISTHPIQKRLKDFHNILLDPPKSPPIITTIGTLDPPLGNTRLHVIKLFASVISSNSNEVIQEIINIGTFPVLLDLFFKYSWNNFLHTQVENCLVSALKTYVSKEQNEISNALCKHLLVNCKLLDRILDAWKDNDQQQTQDKGVRQGYMGHLISIVNKIIELCSTTSLGQYLKENLPEVAKSLDEFKDGTLNEINKVQESLLGGAHPMTSIEENDEYGDIQFPQSSALQQQMFSQYQIHHLTAQYIDGYSGFNDDAFNDGDDTLQTIDHRTDVNFDLSETDLVQQHELFKQVCAQNINTLDDADDQIFEDKEHTFQTVIEKQGDHNDALYSSDSDDESPPGDDTMDVDPWSSPKNAENAIGSISTVPDPWSTGDNHSSDANPGGWADFSSATFEANFANVFEQKDKSKDSVVESDLKVESVEHPDCQSKDETSKETSSISFVSVTQEVKSTSDVEIANKSAAGDQGDDTSSSDKKETCTTVEPSKKIDGDSSPMSKEATEEQKLRNDQI